MSDDLKLNNFTLENLFLFKKSLERSISFAPQDMPHLEEYLKFLRDKLDLVREEIFRRGEESNFSPPSNL